MPFDPDQYLQAKQPAFNPDSYLSSKQAAPEKSAGNPAMAALEGFGQTATMGYLPQIQAAVEKILPNPTADADAKLKQLGIGVPDDSYVSMRDQNIARQKRESQENPTAALVGKAAGIAAPMLLGGGEAEATKFLPAVGKGAAIGAATGAVYNPGDTAGQLDPLQLEDRAKNAALGAAVGGVASGIGQGVNYLSNISKNVSRVKDSANLSSGVKDEIDSALQDLNDNEIKPRADALRDFLQGKTVSVNTDLLKGVDPKIDSIVERAAGDADEAGLSEISAKNAQRIRRALDSQANYAASKPFDTAAVARGEDAKAAADVLRSKLSQLGPEVDDLNSGMRNAINIRDTLAQRARTSPIAAIRGDIGTDKGSLIDTVDQMAGSHLRDLGDDLDTARNLLLKPRNLAKPLELPNELRKMAVRSMAAPAQAIDAATPNGSGQALFRALLESERKK